MDGLKLDLVAPGGLFRQFRAVSVYKSLAAVGPGVETKATKQTVRLVFCVHPVQAAYLLEQSRGVMS